MTSGWPPSLPSPTISISLESFSAMAVITRWEFFIEVSLRDIYGLRAVVASVFRPPSNDALRIRIKSYLSEFYIEGIGVTLCPFLFSLICFYFSILLSSFPDLSYRLATVSWYILPKCSVNFLKSIRPCIFVVGIMWRNFGTSKMILTLLSSANNLLWIFRYLSIVAWATSISN